MFVSLNGDENKRGQKLETDENRREYGIEHKASIWRLKFSKHYEF